MLHSKCQKMTFNIAWHLVYDATLPSLGSASRIYLTLWVKHSKCHEMDELEYDAFGTPYNGVHHLNLYFV